MEISEKTLASIAARFNRSFTDIDECLTELPQTRAGLVARTQLETGMLWVRQTIFELETAIAQERLQRQRAAEEVTDEEVTDELAKEGKPFPGAAALRKMASGKNKAADPD